MQLELTTIVIRTCNPKNFFLLIQSIQSICNNDYRPIQVIVVIQSIDHKYINKVFDLCDIFCCNQLDCMAIVNNTVKDERAKNLNLGLESAIGKYVGFLDDDDILYPRHISTIIKVLKEFPIFAWAYTDCASVTCDCDENNSSISIISSETSNHTKNFFSLSKLCQNGFIAIHSYLIDRTRVSKEILKFHESLSVLEDYEFMLRLAKNHEPIYIPEITCEYRHYIDCRNSNYFLDQELGKNFARKAEIWWLSYKKVESKKKELFPEYKIPFFSYARRSYWLSKVPSLYFVRKLWKTLKKYKSRIFNSDGIS